MKSFFIVSLMIASAVAIPSWNSHQHVPVIKNGVPVDTLEVQHARAEHYAAVAKAGGYATGHDSYAHDYSHNNHADVKYDGKYGYHYPTIKNGVPVEPEAVQHARAAHLAKVAATGHHYAPEHTPIYDHAGHHEEKYDGKYGYHYPTIKNGVPVEPEAVQHARAAHLAKVAATGHYDYHQSSGPKETHEVQHAKAAHFAAHAEAKARLHHVYKRSADYYHYPTIKNGVPVDTPAVQHAKAVHFAAIAKAGGYATGGDKYAHDYSHHADSDIKYDGKYGYHYPTIKNGVPVEPEAVQHARAAHLAKVAGHGYQHADDSYAHDYSHNDHSDKKYDGKYGYHYPTIKNGVPVEPEAVQHARAAHLAKVAHAPGHNGAPVDTPEVQHAKAVHFALVAEAKAKIPTCSYKKDDGQWEEKKYW